MTYDGLFYLKWQEETVIKRKLTKKNIVKIENEKNVGKNGKMLNKILKNVKQISKM